MREQNPDDHRDGAQKTHYRYPGLDASLLRFEFRIILDILHQIVTYTPLNQPSRRRTQLIEISDERGRPGASKGATRRSARTVSIIDFPDKDVFSTPKSIKTLRNCRNCENSICANKTQMTTVTVRTRRTVDIPDWMGSCKASNFSFCLYFLSQS